MMQKLRQESIPAVVHRALPSSHLQMVAPMEHWHLIPEGLLTMTHVDAEDKTTAPIQGTVAIRDGAYETRDLIVAEKKF